MKFPLAISLFLFGALMFVQAVPVLAAGPLIYCGSVNGYVAPSSSAAGSTTLGSRTYEIAPGTAVPDQMTRVTGPSRGGLCVTGFLNEQGQFTSIQSAHPYGAIGPGTELTFTICGTVATYRAPQGSADGLLRFENGRETIVPTGTTVPPEGQTGYRCFDGDVNSVGDAIIVRLQSESPSATQRPAPSTLPSTATEENWASIGAITALVGLAIVSLLLFSRKRSA